MLERARCGGQEGGEEVYSGDCNTAGQRQGRGTLRRADGSIFEGGFQANKLDGHGVLREANGTVYDGSWKAGVKEGPFTVTQPDGRALLLRYHDDEPYGLGVRFSESRDAAWLHAWHLRFS